MKDLQTKRTKTSIYRGVHFDRGSQKWHVTVSLGGGQQEYVGRFDDEIDAAKAYNVAATQIWGNRAQLNPVDTTGFELPRKNRHSRYLRGVYTHNKNKKKPYGAKIRINNKTIELGYFATPKEAALAYNKAVLEARKVSARTRYLNEIGDSK
jgi:AP2-like factor (euAP2 lineage)